MTVAQEKQIRAPGEVAQRYARAFEDYLSDSKQDKATVLEQVRALRKAIAQLPDLRTALADPRLDISQTEKLVKALGSALGLGEALQRFVGFIAHQRRLSGLDEILSAVLLLDARQRGEVRVEVTTARPMEDGQRESLRASLQQAGYANIAMTEHVDQTLLGGMVVRVGSVLFDTSIAGRLARLQNAMKGAA
ncbi:MULTISPECIES: ATP synthase F1 subunit delta [Acetobacteraceae]|uniref:ATP synthase subunit delta n=1 Tax=Parasaccharibacter apium TaxID=1510841 RepID=A0A7U7G5H8_9PROT|nr:MULTISPECIES: ATP synthase F1 subunit delta [Acetobacteraceae]MCK8637789.1 ATP synthase F1 subunit delta [Parasaccharibacter sp. TMW2.1885]MCL1512537.1 ATP synthase F1 subunit delta [Parasaccharibacter sp. TMW 2.1884]MCL1514225.1 ATP synthase F1 subunit delta [Parasaccharibacter sp. TMW 2.1891]MCL1563483.1 ATP synthase F1 subunit delta [Parasaccharibacter sp. TMW 2.1886]QGT74448.1 ATP synthase F1 subunit delta [Bombella sp. ESL0368]